jgi:ribosomal protein S18 acetylase RimI-like enzyme
MAEDEAAASGDVTVRPARADDREAVLAFTARTWGEDGDYIDAVWERWLGDESGVLLLAERAGVPLAMAHLRMLSEDEAWIEGVRVDPQVRRQGVGRVLISRTLVAARERGAAVARLFTDADNLAAQALFTRFGFVRVAELVRYAAEPLEASASGDLPSLTTPGPDDFERIWSWLEQSNLAPFNGGLEIDEWTARAETEPRLRDALAARQVTLLDAWQSIQALAVVAPERWAHAEDVPPLLVARYIDGQADGIGRLALALRQRAAELDCAGVRLWLPDLLILRDAMDGAGYQRRGDTALYAYAREL